MKKWILLLLSVGAFFVVASRIFNHYISVSIDSDIRGSREYAIGMETFQSSVRAHELLGENLSAAGGQVNENSKVFGDSSNPLGPKGHGDAVLDIPVSGSNKKGTLYVKASEREDIWQVDELALRVDGQSTWTKLLPVAQK